MAKDWNDPRVEQWEAELKKSLYSPFGFSTQRYNLSNEKGA